MGAARAAIGATLFERVAEPPTRTPGSTTPSSIPFFGPLNWRETLLFIRAARPRSRRPAPEDRRRRWRPRARLMRVAISLRLDQRATGRRPPPTSSRPSGWAWTASGPHEAWGHDAVTPLAFMAARTSRIRLGSGIMQAGTRTPALLAMTAMSLASMSGGRFLLGLGVSGPQVIEGWHGIRFDRPVQRMRETVEIVRRAVRGERARVQGAGLRAAAARRRGQGAPLRRRSPQPDIPIYLATLSPRSLEMTGEIADGWLGTSFMPEHARRLLRPHRGRREARRPLAGRSSTCRPAAPWRSATTSSA